MKMDLTEIGLGILEAKIDIKEIPVILHKYDAGRDVEYTEKQTFKNASALFNTIKSDKSIFLYRIDTSKKIFFDFCFIDEKTNKPTAKPRIFDVIFDNHNVGSSYYFCFPEYIIPEIHGMQSDYYLKRNGGHNKAFELFYMVLPAEELNNEHHPEPAEKPATIEKFQETQGGIMLDNKIIAIEGHLHGGPIYNKECVFASIRDLQTACKLYLIGAMKIAHQEKQMQAHIAKATLPKQIITRNTANIHK